jgi:hypothetical protein
MIDLRRTIRRNLSRGGEPIELRRKHGPERPVKLVVLLDASGLMSVYSRYFLNFVRGLIGRWLLRRLLCDRPLAGEPGSSRGPARASLIES